MILQFVACIWFSFCAENLLNVNKSWKCVLEYSTASRHLCYLQVWQSCSLSGWIALSTLSKRKSKSWNISHAEGNEYEENECPNWSKLFCVLGSDDDYFIYLTQYVFPWATLIKIDLCHSYSSLFNNICCYSKNKSISYALLVCIKSLIT